MIEDTAKYAGSDLLCYRATAPVEPGQGASTRPGSRCSDWAAERYGARLVVAEGTTFVAQPPEAVARCARPWPRTAIWRSSALYNLTHISGSLVIALAVAEGHLPADKAFAAAQLDELYQIERWGDDPTCDLSGTTSIRHDIEAGARFLALLEDQRLKG